MAAAAAGGVKGIYQEGDSTESFFFLQLLLSNDSTSKLLQLLLVSALPWDVPVLGSCWPSNPSPGLKGEQSDGGDIKERGLRVVHSRGESCSVSHTSLGTRVSSTYKAILPCHTPKQVSVTVTALFCPLPNSGAVLSTGYQRSIIFPNCAVKWLLV